MTEDDRELEAWKTEWQSLGGREGLAVDLSARVRKETASIRRKVALEVVAAAFSTAASLGIIVKTKADVVAVVACVGILVFNAVWLTRLFTLREHESRDTDTIDATVALLRQRRIDDLRWNRFARWSMIVLGAFLVPWAVWAYTSHVVAYRLAPWRAVVGFGGAFGILAAVFVANEVRRRTLERARARFERLVEERLLP